MSKIKKYNSIKKEELLAASKVIKSGILSDYVGSRGKFFSGGREVKNFVTSCTHLVFKMIQLVIQVTPYGVFVIMSWVVADYGVEIMLHLGKFILIVLALQII